MGAFPEKHQKQARTMRGEEGKAQRRAVPVLTPPRRLTRTAAFLLVVIAESSVSAQT